MLNMAEFRPMPTASDASATRANPRWAIRPRTAYFTSFSSASIMRDRTAPEPGGFKVFALIRAGAILGRVSGHADPGYFIESDSRPTLKP